MPSLQSRWMRSHSTAVTRPGNTTISSGMTTDGWCKGTRALESASNPLAARQIGAAVPAVSTRASERPSEPLAAGGIVLQDEGGRPVQRDQDIDGTPAITLRQG